MSVSVKCQYALRSLFELAKRKGGGLTRIQEIAAAQAVPVRFLENILNQLRQGGFVESRRGKMGGFALARSPAEITVLEIVSFIDGPVYAFDCEGKEPLRKCPLGPSCVFMPLWRKARRALETVYAGTTLQDLLDSEPPCAVTYDI
ncbi:MAG: Rrf2 family transcriptional regulator [Spirochaetaceae bacterium]|jgi:Rrf2 family protein|nr:Rrf2 family transcriptional regulator [Spirochaetaceae bacterium]